MIAPGLERQLVAPEPRDGAGQARQAVVVAPGQAREPVWQIRAGEPDGDVGLVLRLSGDIDLDCGPVLTGAATRAMASRKELCRTSTAPTLSPRGNCGRGASRGQRAESSSSST